MTNYRIIFTENDVSLPDGACVGIMGEHNAVQLVISLPQSMVTDMDYHTVTIGRVESARIVEADANVDGAYRVGNTIYQPLTAAYTECSIVDLSVTAYKQLGDAAQVVDKTPTVYGLRFNGGTPLKVPGGLAAEVAALARKVAQIKGLETVQALPETPEADKIIYLDGVGIFHYKGSKWEQLSDNGAGLSGLEQLIDAIRQDLPTAEEIERWNAAAAARHSHENKPSLDKLIVVPAYADLPANAEDGAVAFVTTIEEGSKSMADYDASTDAESDVFIEPEPTYDANVTQLDDAFLATPDGEVTAIGFVPVYADSDTSRDTYGFLDNRFLATDTPAYPYMIGVYSTSTHVEAVLADIDAEIEPENVSGVFFMHAFEGMEGAMESDGTTLPYQLSVESGWNVFVAVGSLDAEQIENVIAATIADPNEYITIPHITSDDDFRHDYGEQILIDCMRITTAGTDNRGLYTRTNGHWIRIYEPQLHSLDERVNRLEHGEPDDVSLLGFGTYTDLVVRDEVISGESIQDVPVYIHGYTAGEDICKLYMHTDSPYTNDYNEPYDMIALTELRESYTTGMPMYIIRVLMNNVYASYFPRDFYGNHGTVYAGWNRDDQPCDPPTIAGFTPNRLMVNGTTYDDLSDLPDAARSALRSLSQCINVSAAAMGTITVPDDAVVRFSGTIAPNRKYSFTTGDDCTFTLPTVPFGETDAQFVLYLTCTADVDLTFPTGTYFSNEINSDTGNHKLIGCWLKDAGALAIGCIDYEVAT